MKTVHSLIGIVRCVMEQRVHIMELSIKVIQCHKIRAMSLKCLCLVRLAVAVQNKRKRKANVSNDMLLKFASIGTVSAMRYSVYPIKYIRSTFTCSSKWLQLLLKTSIHENKPVDVISMLKTTTIIAAATAVPSVKTENLMKFCDWKKSETPKRNDPTHWQTTIIDLDFGWFGMRHAYPNKTNSCCSRRRTQYSVRMFKSKAVEEDKYRVFKPLCINRAVGRMTATEIPEETNHV